MFKKFELHIIFFSNFLVFPKKRTKNPKFWTAHSGSFSPARFRPYPPQIPSLRSVYLVWEDSGSVRANKREAKTCDPWKNLINLELFFTFLKNKKPHKKLVIF